MTHDPAALLAEIAELKGRLARCVELPEIPRGLSLVIDDLGAFGFYATLRDSNDDAVHSSGTLHPTPAAAIAALKESMDAK